MCYNEDSVVCETNMCNGCMACVNVCVKNAISIKDNINAYNSFIDKNKCVECNRCKKICPRNTEVECKKPILWKEGWAKDEEIRSRSSSGGFATAIMKAFIVKKKGYVFSCVFEQGKFKFKIAETPEECDKFTGSKYIKSNPGFIYRKILELLRDGYKVLFLGLPCQVAGLKNYIGKQYLNELYTIDLICHGTPSPILLNKYLMEDSNLSLETCSNISFRKKLDFNLYNGKNKIVPQGVQDRYTMAFLDSLDYTENCYYCQYAKIQRISDISLGDSWASKFMSSNGNQGISLALCQTKKGEDLLNIANLELFEVDIEKAILANKQLRHPSMAPKQRKNFFNNINCKMKFKDAVFHAYPRLCMKQDIKSIFIRLKILR